MPLNRASVAEQDAGPNTGSGVNFAMKDVAPLDYDVDDFLTTKVYHGVSIVSGLDANAASTVIGRIQSWQPQPYNRDGVHLYELADISWGRPVEYVPGRTTGFTISVTRAEVFYSEMEKAFGFGFVFEDLQDQDRPFNISEFWLRGDSEYHIWEYRGCWFQDKNVEALTADGDGITRVSATIAFTSHLLNTSN